MVKQALTVNHHSRESSESAPVVTKVGLLLLLICSSFLALYRSDSAFTSDEVWSIKVSSLSYSSEIQMLKADVHPPLYYQILYAWIRMFGTGERAVRSLSGLFYVLSIYAVYGIGRDLYGNKTALLCAALYLSSPLAILSAQFARMYALLSLLSILSTWLYLQFSIKPRNSGLLFALYIAVNILGTFTHVAFFFVLFGQLVFHLFFYRRLRTKRFVVANLLTLFPYLFLWASNLWGQIARSGEGLAWIKRPGLSSIAELLFLYGGAFWLLVPVSLYLWWRGGSKSVSWFSKLRVVRVPLWLLAITILTPVLISQFKPVFNPRFGIIGLHLFALTVAAIIDRESSYFLASQLILLAAIGLFFLHPGFTNCDNRSIAAHLSESANDDDVVIFTSLTRLPIDHYLQRAHTTKQLFETSFPAEIDQHPGYEGRIDDPSRRATLESEGRELVNKIVEMKLSGRARRIFFLHGAHPEIDSILEGPLRERFELLAGEGLQCSEASPYFKEVTVYR